ncbi:MAG TPA: copper chaperone PCu(A)C [Acidiferrobacterales bacterium]
MIARYLLMPCLAAAPVAVTAQAAETIQVEDAWIREAPPGAAVLAAYLTLENRGDAERALVGADSPDFGRIEIHATRMKNGMASMEQLKHLKIAARGREALAPGGTHLMLMQPRRALRAGDRVTLTLRFAGGANLATEAVVRRDEQPDDHHHH